MHHRFDGTGFHTLVVSGGDFESVVTGCQRETSAQRVMTGNTNTD